MKYFSLSVLLLVLGYRVNLWQEKQEQVLKICGRILAFQSQNHTQIFRGYIEKTASGTWKLNDDRYPQPILFNADEQKLKKFVGRTVLMTGKIRCHQSLKNPGQIADVLYQALPTRFSLVAGSGTIHLSPTQSASFRRFLSDLRALFDFWIEKSFSSYPGLWAFEKALWNGTTEELPETFKQFYREGGLMQILALSGQHITAMVLVAGLFHRILFTGLFLFVEMNVFRSLYCAPYKFFEFLFVSIK